jgi:hypothetical protein
MSVARLRQLAARMGHRGTRTMRKDALLTLLSADEDEQPAIVPMVRPGWTEV